MMPFGAKPRDFYTFLPAPRMRCGDIWSNVPTGGLLGRPRVAAMLVTPACDLENQKSDSCLLLPILPLKDVLLSPMFHRRHVGHLRSVAKLEDVSTGDNQAETIVTLARSKISSLKELDQQRVEAGISCTTSSARWTDRKPDISQLLTFYGEKPVTKLIRNLVKNAERADTHFLPADGRTGRDDSAVPSDSLLLFRYPFSIHMDRVLDLESDGSVPIIRTTTVVEAHRVDVVARFLAFFGRVGSPDLSEREVDAAVTRTLARDDESEASA